jgi:hypothetical protein
MERPGGPTPIRSFLDPAGCPAGLWYVRRELGNVKRTLAPDGVALAFGTLFSSQGARPYGSEKAEAAGRHRRPPSIRHLSRAPVR